MRIVDVVVKLSNYFPEIGIESKGLNLLKNIRPNANVKKYLSASFFLSIFISILLFLLLRLEPNLLGLGIALISFAICAVALIKLPSLEYALSISKMESELPITLRTLSLLLEMNIPFQRAIKIVSEERGALNKELRLIITYVERGASLQKELSAFSSNIKSLIIKRAINQIIIVYQAGAGAQDLKKLADELLSIQRFKLREYSSRVAILGLIFIALSTILPTLFIVTTILGKGIIESEFNKEQIIVIFLLAFPALATAVVLIAKSTLPNIIFENKGKPNYTPIIAALLLVAALLTLRDPLDKISILAISAILFLIFILNYKKQKRIAEIEDQIPDALMAASAIPKGVKLDRIFEMWQDKKYGALALESKTARKQLEANVKPEKVLFSLSERNDSQILKRVCGFITLAINTNTMDRLSYVADDILKFREIDRERNNTLATQKYTLIFSSLLMPLIIKSTIGLAHSMQEVSKAAVDFNVFYSIMPAYIIIYALLTSYFISELEGKKHNVIIYFIATSMLAVITFYFINI